MVRVRHKCVPKYLLKVNENLTKLQKAKINDTPFKWLMQMPEKLPINGSLLCELFSRWVARRLGFTIRSTIVPITPLDVCFATGLRIVGETVSFDKDDDDDDYCRTKSLFHGEKITIPKIFEQLQKLNGDEHVEDFCRLYILLGFAEFYCPNTNNTVHSGLLRTLDDLHSLDKYSWGVFIYDALVDGLIEAVKRFRDAKSSTVVYITGCAAVLQIWAWEHMSLHHSETFTDVPTFPRFIHWHHLTLGKKKISTMFENNWICQQLAASNEDLEHEVVREAMQKAPAGFLHWYQLVYQSRYTVHDINVLDAEVKELQDKISMLEEDLRMINLNLPTSPKLNLPTTISTSQGEENLFENLNGGSPYVFDVSISDGHGVDTPEQQQSNMYTRRKDQPRKRVATAISQPPWTTYHRKRKKMIQ